MADETVNEEVINDPDYTCFEEVYRVFLGTVESYYFSKMDDEELSETLFGYLNNGISVFSTYISKDFTDLDQEKGRFNFKLSRIEITILARAMKLEWVRSHKYSQELMEKAIGDRDYAAVQGYKYLDRLSAMDKSLQREIKTLINELEYADEELYGDMLNG